MTNPADIEYLNKLVARVNTLREHAATVRQNSIASLHTPNFVLVETEPVFADLDIPHPHDSRPKLSRRRIFAGSAGAAVTFVCLSLALMMSLVQT